MKILTITHEYPPVGGGGGVAVDLLVKELKKNHKIYIITVGNITTPKVENKQDVVICRIKIPWKTSIEAGNKFVAVFSFFLFIFYAVMCGFLLLLEEKFDVIHSHFVLPAGVSGAILSYIFHIPHVVTIYEADVLDVSKNCLVPYKNFVLKSIIKLILNKASCIVAISTRIKNVIQNFYNIKKDISVINWGINLTKPKPNTKLDRCKLGLTDKDFVIISIGRLVKRKGFEFLIEAMNKIQNPNIKLLLVGDGPEKKQIQQLIKKYNLDNRVKLLGKVSTEEKYKLLLLSEIFVLPSLHEGFGIVILEAMSVGLPVIVTNNGGQTDIVLDGINGFLIPICNAEKIAEKILQLYLNPQLREKMSLNNIDRIKNFSIENTCNKYNFLFQQLKWEI